MYVAIAAGVIDRTGSWSIVSWTIAAGICNAVQASMYDYHRTAYARVVVSGRAPAGMVTAKSAGALAGVVAIYERVQETLTGAHTAVERAIAERAVSGQVGHGDRERYRSTFYRPVLGWNFLGDNMRRYAIAAAVWLHRPEWFLIFILVPMNLVLIAMWMWQQRADRRFLTART
jgi:hypothetical protein